MINPQRKRKYHVPGDQWATSPLTASGQDPNSETDIILKSTKLKQKCYCHKPGNDKLKVMWFM